MKLTKGTKFIYESIPLHIPHKIKTYPNGYVEIEIDDATEINRLKASGFKEKI